MAIWGKKIRKNMNDGKIKLGTALIILLVFGILIVGLIGVIYRYF